jgi:outer membrane protein assembly factor BamA
MNEKLLLFAKLVMGLALCLAAVWPIQAKESKPAAKRPDQKTATSLVAIPVVFYAPETKWAGGAAGLMTFRTEGQDPASRPSSLYLYVIYTQLKQFSAQIVPAFYLKNEAYLLNGILTFERYPNKFWGFGNEAPSGAEQNYTPRTYSLEVSFQKRILATERLYLGLQYQFERQTILQPTDGSALDENTVPGSKGGTVSGLGFILNWDTRNNIFIPSHGNYWQASAYFNGKTLGSDFSFTQVKVDLRTYLPGIAPSHVLALQALYQSATGPSAPFYRYARLGGDSLLRGYYKGRYRDKHCLAVQAEYRLPVWWKFGVVGFAALGDVAPSFDKFRIAKFKYAVGMGLRFKIAPKEGANLRADFAFGPGTSGIYFTAGEAF